MFPRFGPAVNHSSYWAVEAVVKPVPARVALRENQSVLKLPFVLASLRLGVAKTANVSPASPLLRPHFLRHHHGRSAPLLPLALRGVKSRHHNVAALPGASPPHSAASCPTAGMLSQALSITNGASPYMVSRSSSVYLRRLTGDNISRPASNSKLTLSPGCSPVLLASACGMVTAIEPPAALSVEVCMVLPLVCST